MDIFFPILVLGIGFFIFWFLLTGIIVIFTGKDISIGDLPEYIRRWRVFDNYRYEYHDILMRKFRYYNRLPEELRPRFLRRVTNFISAREFIGNNGIELTSEHKLLVAATAVQLTFGLDKYLLGYFSRVIIYPKEYFSTLGRTFHKGEVNNQGAIVLSMEDFFYGLETEDDGINLGIHEMAHALQLELVLQQDFEDFFGAYYKKWQQEAERERLNMSDHQDELLRDYATTNMAEFFAVCAENFFERPQAFREKKPELYQRFSILLNQDPAEPNSLLCPPRKALSAENMAQADPGKLLYQSGFPLKNVWVGFGYMLFLMIFIIIASRNLTVSIVLFAIFGVISLLRLSVYHRLQLYDNFIMVRPFLLPGIRRKSFDYRRIIMLSFHDPQDDVVSISYFSGGSIVQKRFNWSDTASGTETISEILKGKGVLIR